MKSELSQEVPVRVLAINRKRVELEVAGSIFVLLKGDSVNVTVNLKVEQ